MIGFKKEDGSIQVHKRNCQTAIRLASQDGDSIVDVDFEKECTCLYPVRISVRAIDRYHLLSDLVDCITEKLQRRGLEVTIDNIYTHIQDVAGIRVICNYLDDIYYMRRLLTRTESFGIQRETDYIKEPKDTGYRSLHLILDVPIVISEGTLHLPVEVQLRTIAMDMWASLEHELRYKSDRDFSESDAARLRLCSEAIGEIDREMQRIYLGEKPEYEV